MQVWRLKAPSHSKITSMNFLKHDDTIFLFPNISIFLMIFIFYLRNGDPLHFDH